MLRLLDRLAEKVAGRMVSTAERYLRDITEDQFEANRIRARDKWTMIYFADGTPYLCRYKLFKFDNQGGLYIHAILKSDDPEPHDHPFHFISAILLGGYKESILEVETGDIYSHERGIGSIRFRDARTAHVLTLRGDEVPAITLFLRGPRFRDWGFYHGRPPQWTEWKNWLRGKGHHISEDA